jgi:hypothetical protein
METIGNITVGNPIVRPSAPSHTRGVHEGNLAHRRDEPGIQQVKYGAVADPRRSTGINPDAHNPIDPRMPVVTPA